MLIISILAAIDMVGQETYPYNRRDFKSLVLKPYNYVYTDSNCEKLYEYAISLAKLTNPDSSFKATRIFWGLELYDTARFALAKAEQYLEQISIANKAHFDSLLLGAWRFRHNYWTGMVSEVTTTTDVDTGNVVVFDRGYAYFYFKDSLKRQTTYKLTKPERGFAYNQVNYFLIAFGDREDKWGFEIERGKKAGEAYLTIYPDPYCACGCRQDEYKRITKEISVSANERTTRVL